MKKHLEKARILKSNVERARRKIQYFSQLRHAYEQLQQDFGTGVTVDQAAKYAALSESAFRKLFKRATGLSFHNFLILEALYRAINLIETSDEALTNIALEAGFENLWSFEYNFKHHIGCLPSKYRTDFLDRF